MIYREGKKIDGLLMIINFQKVFDLYNNGNLCVLFFCVKLGFTTNLIKLFQPFNTDSASFLQFGVLSEFFSIKTGYKQSNPAASYQFILCGQILNLLIEKVRILKGLQLIYRI